ncbi:MAG: reverse transcriptase domain-containing protein [Methylobacter sp.]|uniref:reverse transcriptase domain-containing protein n=1 Tax=Methylobacter sp. TaxID=2051955 RepID=UPI0025E20129|nr:reverse transcriptase domain-containing protein [Methylobacter sp.]MCK9619122.1 reverse transcriptase domain-containing protein [Methylobacter sp.]
MKENFLKIKDHDELAAFFGLSYSNLAAILYKTSESYKYQVFLISKKSGGHRIIKSPRRKLKDIQNKLSDVLYEIYPGKPSAHGFVKKKSILTNSKKHLNKSYVFNIDLSDYFGSIHFGRVRNLFKAYPFNFNHSVSTILAQICCFANCLPQGAPTSPIISNMVAWKLDGKLQHLAKITNSTYTRYADDITFSFTCSSRRLPEEIVILRDGVASPGHALSRAIEENGFEINYEKVRLAGEFQRMEVTGITVNEFPNVSRKYIKQISSILHAWRKYGYEAAEKDFNHKYDKCHIASNRPKSLKYVIKGKLSFLRSIRGGRDQIFIKYAKQYNALVGDDALKFKLIEETEPETNAINALWVIQTCYDDSAGNLKIAQGTGFLLEDFELVTCAHVVSEDGEAFENIKAFKCFNFAKEYDVKVKHLDIHRDIAICSITSAVDQSIPNAVIQLSDREILPGLEARLLGFPAYKDGQSHYIVDTKIASIFTRHTFRKFEIDAAIREGNSGGPIIDTYGKLLGVALEGAEKSSGNNAALYFSELKNIKDDLNKKSSKPNDINPVSDTSSLVHHGELEGMSLIYGEVETE